MYAFSRPFLASIWNLIPLFSSLRISVLNVRKIIYANRQFTVVAGGVTVYAIGDMIIFNRKKRAEFYAEQKFKYAMALESAQRAAAVGSATEAQLGFLEREKEREQTVKIAEEAKKKSGPWNKSKEWLFSGLKKEEEGNDVGTSERRLGYEALSEEDDNLGERESDILRAIQEKKMTIQDKAKSVFEAEKERQKKGGPLDRIGTEAGEEKPKSGGWTSFMIRR